MKIWKNFVISLGVVVVAAPLAIVGVFIYVTSDMCGNEVYSEVLSPDQEHKAVVFQRDCGATTGFSTQISIIDANDNLRNESGNIYIIDGHPRDFEFGITWLSSSDLRIDRRLNGSEHKAELKWGFLKKINITYGAGSS